MAIETKKYLDLAGLTHFWDNIKDYIDNKSISATAIETLIGKVAGDDALSARQITEDVLIKALIPEDAKESLDTLEEIAKWIQNHPDDVAAMSGNIAKIAEEVELDSKTLEYDDVYENTKTVRGDIVGAKDKFEKIAEEVEMNPDTLEYTSVYAATNSVYSDLVAAKGEIGGLKNTFTDIKGLSYTDIIAALDAATPEVGPNYLKFTGEEDNSTISLNAKTSPDIKYSLNEGEWTQWDYSTITLNTGDTVRMKGNNSNGFNTTDTEDEYNNFKMTGKISASGNIMSLLYDDDFEGKLTIPCDYCFTYMFEDCDSLTTAPELPATTLADGCYYQMFRWCTSLIAAPELPAMTLADYCYSQMFYYCTSLTTAPELPAMTLAGDCYAYMFARCTALTTAPELPAMTLANYCYSGMFRYCESLTTAPELPAMTLANYCYSGMFKGCTKLNHIKMLATDIIATDCLNDWVNGVASTGTFIKHPNMTSLSTGPSGIPSGWTVQDAA